MKLYYSQPQLQLVARIVQLKMQPGSTFKATAEHHATVDDEVDFKIGDTIEIRDTVTGSRIGGKKP